MSTLSRIPKAATLRTLLANTKTKFSYLLSVEADAKTQKGEKKGYLTGVMYLAPFTYASDAFGKKINLCPHATAGCAAACLFTSGRARMFEQINIARTQRTLAFMRDRNTFLTLIAAEIQALEKKAAREGKIPAVRLNGTSDLEFHRFKWIAPNGETFANIFEAFPHITFYDYTKNPKRANDFASGDLPSNYDVTFSLADGNEEKAQYALTHGLRVAAVFGNGLPKTYMGAPVIDGDETDLRFLDPSGVIVGLKAKGEAKKDKSGFVKFALPVLS